MPRRAIVRTVWRGFAKHGEERGGAIISRANVAPRRKPKPEKDPPKEECEKSEKPDKG